MSNVNVGREKAGIRSSGFEREREGREYYIHWEEDEGEIAEDGMRRRDKGEDERVGVGRGGNGERLGKRVANNNGIRSFIKEQDYDDHISEEGWRGADENEDEESYEGGGRGRDGRMVMIRHGNVGSRSDRNVPHGKFNVQVDYEDAIETSSSASFSSGYGRSNNHPPPRHHQQQVQNEYIGSGKNQSHGGRRKTTRVKSTWPQIIPSSSPSSQIKYLNPPSSSVNNNSSTLSVMSKGIYHGGTTGSGRGRAPEIPEKFRDEKDGSEIYVMDSYVKPPASVYGSHYSGKSRAPSEMSSVKTKTSRKGGVVVETMSAPNPCCPNTKGVCCLLLLVNLGLILVTLGFSIVLQLYDPPFVWYCGVAFLIVGFLALIASLIFCVHLCRESEEARRNGVQPGEMYWTHHWQKRIPIPGMGREVEKADDVSTVYSTRNERDEDKYYAHGREDRRDMTPIHTYAHH